MVLTNIFSRKIFENEVKLIKSQNKSIAFFDNNGLLIDVFPRNNEISLYEDRQTAYLSDYIIYNMKIYNMYDANSVSSMEIPNFSNTFDVTMDLAYIMKMHRGRNEDKELQLAIAYKTFDMLKASRFSLIKKDCISLCSTLLKLGLYDESDKLYNDGINYIEEERLFRFRERTLNHDLVISSNHHPTCGICSMYRNRVFSISGKDKRFPKLPEHVMKIGGFHKGCRCILFPYFEGVKIGDNNDIDAVEYSNRPFIDERSESEVNDYEKRINTPERIGESYDLLKESYILREINMKEYKQICLLCPDIAPKSFSGYCRMKSMKTKNYLKLKKILEDN